MSFEPSFVRVVGTLWASFHYVDRALNTKSCEAWAAIGVYRVSYRTLTGGAPALFKKTICFFTFKFKFIHVSFMEL